MIAVRKWTLGHPKTPLAAVTYGVSFATCRTESGPATGLCGGRSVVSARLVGTSSAFVLLLAGACSVGQQDPRETSAPTSSPSSASPTLSPEDQAIAAYEGMWDVAVDASRDASDDHPELEKYASGDAAELMRQGLRGVEKPLSGEPKHHLEVLSTEPSGDPTSVELRDCQDGSYWIPEGESPSQEKDIRVDATVTRDALSWRVTEVRIWGPQTC